jgi:hypothetical protein
MSLAADVSVEFGHTYGDRGVGDPQRRGVAVLKEEVAKLAREGKTFSSLVLLDDIHVGGEIVTPRQLKNELESLGGRVDAVVLESSLITSAKATIRKLPRESLHYEPFRKASKMVLFVETGQGPVALGSITRAPFRPTCALLVAAWHLARLGALPVQGIPTARLSCSILSEEYREVECKAKAILESSAFQLYAKRIKHIFY